MRMYDLILKKREGGCLTESEINYIVKGYTQGSIPDYQMSAFLMAVYFKGLSDEETFALTKAMTDSGEKLDLSCIPGVKADKHSTGGVGDKTTLVLAPMIASLGINMAKMSGRGLGNTGGTIDKLESFPGFNTSLTNEQFIENIKHIGIAVNGPTLSLAPADKKIYALRDVTATVENVSLIASSIMSKKLAAGADIIVLDVKSGSGAFMKNEHDALQLAHEMVKIGKASNKQTIAVISDMNQPLGHNIGNALEVVEAIESKKYDTIILNYANPDMVGHTGNIEAAVKAIETIDACVGRVIEAIEKVNGVVLITADHGNSEQMIDYATGEPHTAHTTNPVPLILVGKKATLKPGRLADLAPTMLDIMGIEKPAEMTGESLIVNN